VHKKGTYDLAIGMTLHELQEERNIAREDMAKVLEISDLAVTRIENGAETMTAGDLVLLIEHLNITWEEFLERVRKNHQKAEEQMI
jgi:transcriptional regulator with XRE-family HTH domain